jgi:hypothetical protein
VLFALAFEALRSMRAGNPGEIEVISYTIKDLNTCQKENSGIPRNISDFVKELRYGSMMARVAGSRISRSVTDFAVSCLCTFLSMYRLSPFVLFCLMAWPFLWIATVGVFDTRSRLSLKHERQVRKYGSNGSYNGWLS